MSNISEPLDVEFYREARFKKVKLSGQVAEVPEDWEVVRLGDVAELIMGQSPPSETYNENKEGMPFLQGKAEFGTIFPRHIKYTTKPLKIAKKGSVLVSVRAPVGDVNLANMDYCIGRGLASICSYNSDNTFLFYQLKLRKTELEQKSGGSTFKAIGRKDLEEFLIIKPPLPEQKKIATVLKTIDDAIEAVQKSIEKLKRIKKGLMQRLLTRGINHTRFKKTEIGEIPEEWEVVRIREIAEVVRGGSPRPKGDPRYFSQKPTGIHWITISDLSKYRNGVYLTGTDEFLTKEGKRYSRYLESGTLVLTNSGTVGIPAVLAINGCIHDGYLALLNIKNADKFYLYYIFENMRNYFFSIAPKGTQANLNTSIVSNVRIPLPPLPEQKKIAEILMTIDNVIKLKEKKKEKLERMKKKVMDLLLSGKVRVK